MHKTLFRSINRLYKCTSGIIMLEAFADDNSRRTVEGVTRKLPLPTPIEPGPLESISLEGEYNI